MVYEIDNRKRNTCKNACFSKLVIFCMKHYEYRNDFYTRRKGMFSASISYLDRQSRIVGSREIRHLICMSPPESVFYTVAQEKLTQQTHANQMPDFSATYDPTLTIKV